MPFLIKALEDKEPLIRAHTVWALGELLLSECITIFDEKLAEEAESMVLQELDGLRQRFV